MKPGLKAAVAFSVLALAASGSLAQTTPKPDSRTPAPSHLAQGPATPAAPRAMSGPPTFHSLDANSDGMISKSEAEGVPDLVKAFNRLDKNRNGKLDRTEFSMYKGR